MNTYRTSEVAKIIGIHPNTVRKYEESGLIPKAKRKPNGYRMFTEFHLEQLRLARIAFQIEVGSLLFAVTGLLRSLKR